MESTNDFSSNKKTSNGDNQQTRFAGYELFIGMCLALGVCAVGMVVVKDLEKNRIEKQKSEKQEFAREILNDYQAEQSRTKTVNIDSLINQHIH
jgi:hypothetical protein